MTKYGNFTDVCTNLALKKVIICTANVIVMINFTQVTCDVIIIASLVSSMYKLNCSQLTQF